MINRVVLFTSFLPFLWIFSGLLSYNSDKHFVIICVLSFFLSLNLLKKANISDILNNNKFVIIIFIAAALAIITKVSVGQGTSVLRVLIAISLISLTLNKRVILTIREYLPWLSALGCITSLIYIVTNTYILKLLREHWNVNPIPYTAMVASLTSISLYYALFASKKSVRIISLFACLCGLSGIFISETRGTLLALIFSTILMFFAFIKASNSKIHILKVSLIITTFCVGVIYLNADILEKRLHRTQFEISAILDGNYNTSIGLRLNMWKAGFELAKSPTLIGLGNKHIEMKQNLANQGIIPQNVVKWPHYHNDYISSFVKRGILGFTILLTLLLFPIYAFYKNRTPQTFIATTISLVYGICSITDIPLSQASPLIFYLIIMIVLCSNYTHSENEA